MTAAPGLDPPPPPAGTRYELVFWAEGVVGKGTADSIPAKDGGDGK
jgi:hypothetical protein